MSNQIGLTTTANRSTISRKKLRDVTDNSSSLSDEDQSEEKAVDKGHIRVREDGECLQKKRCSEWEVRQKPKWVRGLSLRKKYYDPPPNSKQGWWKKHEMSVKICVKGWWKKHEISVKICVKGCWKKHEISVKVCVKGWWKKHEISVKICVNNPVIYTPAQT